MIQVTFALRVLLSSVLGSAVHYASVRALSSYASLFICILCVVADVATNIIYPVQGMPTVSSILLNIRSGDGDMFSYLNLVFAFSPPLVNAVTMFLLRRFIMIGLTGLIASGKSTVLQTWRRVGRSMVHCIDAD